METDEDNMPETMESAATESLLTVATEAISPTPTEPSSAEPNVVVSEDETKESDTEQVNGSDQAFQEEEEPVSSENASQANETSIVDSSQNDAQEQLESGRVEEKHDASGSSEEAKVDPVVAQDQEASTKEQDEKLVEDGRESGVEDGRESGQVKMLVESFETPTKDSHDNTEDDVASKAAVALAAVAAAAMANNKSPSAAALEARNTAKAFISNEAGDATTAAAITRPESIVSTIQTVRLSAVKTHLRRRALETGLSPLTDKLCQGENDAFLQHLLLLEYFRCIDEEEEDILQEKAARNSEKDKDEEEPTTEAETEQVNDEELESRAAIASERVFLLLKKIEGAYESLVDILPDSDSKHQSTNQFEGDISIDEEDFETAVVVPDLLPPCTFPRGDATVSFFRACLGDQAGEEVRKGGSGEATREAASTTIPLAAGESSDSLEKPSISSPSPPPSPGRQGAGVFSSMFRRTSSTKGGFNVFRRKGPRGKEDTSEAMTEASTDTLGGDSSVNCRPGEYIVRIEREMLGLTVENVLERTVVRTVLAGGPAKKAGAKVGSLIVKVGNVETNHLTHFETIDELRRSQRPLQLSLRQISDDSLRSAREEMGRLIRGSGFGTIMDSNRTAEGTEQTEGGNEDVRPLIGNDLRIDVYTNMLRRRIAEAGPQARNKKEEALARVGEKLVWILTLFVVGLEREASRLFALASSSTDSSSASTKRNPHEMYHHTAKDYAEAARSVSRVLFDYINKKLDSNVSNPLKGRSTGFLQHSLQQAVGGLNRHKGGPPPPPPPPVKGRGGRGLAGAPGMMHKSDSSLAHEKPLLQIGDVLQRTRTFLADTTSPPAALLRGELIGFLCDVLDIDTDMELSDVESDSSTAGGKGGGAITDLGSAGGLLKLIVLNCPIMRSPGCEDDSSRDENIVPELEEELRRRFGRRENFSAGDLHRLHAGNRFLAVVHRLAASRSTSARITACSLGPVLWGHLDFPHQLQLRGVITRALHDVEVIVRKSIATVLHEIAELVFDPRSVPWLVLMSERAMTDPEPQLRSAAMTLTWHLAEHLPNAFLGDASQGSRYLQRLPARTDPIFADVYLLQCKLLPVATRLAEDRSPSVRLAVAAQCDRLCDALGDHWSSVVIDVLLALLSDSDERVRCEAVLCVPRLAKIVLLSASPGQTAMSEVSILEALVPASIKLQKDRNSSVRVSLAAAAGELLTLMVALQSRVDHEISSSSDAAAVEKEDDKRYKRQVDERLIPLVQQLLNDADPEVTSAALRAVTNASRDSTHGMQPRDRHMSIASEDDAMSLSSHQSHTSKQKEPVIIPVLSEGQVLRLLPTLTELAGSRQWRVRQSAVEIVPALLGCTQKLETRTEISRLCVQLMNDSVDAVRKTAAECLCMGGSSLGSHGEGASAEWIISIVIPVIRKCAVHAEAKQRLLSLKMVETILLNGACPSRWFGTESEDERMTDSPMRELVVIALSLAPDRIANVRLNVGRTLESVIYVFEDDDLSYIKEVLLEQIESEKERIGGGDRDVLYFSSRCVNRVRTVLEDRSMISQEDEPLPNEST